MRSELCLSKRYRIYCHIIAKVATPLFWIISYCCQSLKIPQQLVDSANGKVIDTYSFVRVGNFLIRLFI